MGEGTKGVLGGKWIHRLIYAVVALFIVCASFCLSGENALAAESVEPEDEIVYIPDANFKAMLNYALDISDFEADITKSQLESLKMLSIPMTGEYAVTDVTGISYCVALETISFFDNIKGEKQTVSKSITDQVIGLRNIKSIFLTYVNCEDYSFMEEWSNLESIHLSECGIDKLPDLSKSTKLRLMYILSCDQISDISSISKLKNLNIVEISACPKLSDISGLWGLTSIYNLHLSSVGFKKEDIPGNIRTIGSMTGLTKLEMLNCNIVDENLNELGNLTNLKILDLSNNKISKIDFVLKLKESLTKLTLSNNRIGNDACAVLAQLGTLSEINLSSCRITDYSFLDYLYDYNSFHGVGIGKISSKNEYHIAYYEEMPSTLVVKNVVKDGNGNYVAPVESKYYVYNEETNEIIVDLSNWKAYTKTIDYEFVFMCNVRDSITISHKQGFDFLEYEDYGVGNDIVLDVENPSNYDGFKVQWYKDGEKLEGATSTCLEIKNAQASDSGRYTLELTVNSVSSPVILMERGLLIYEKSGLIKENGNWYYYVDNAIDRAYIGLAKNEYGWWHITNGTVNKKYTGLSKNEYGWWYVTNGKVDRTYTGMAKNENGWFYVKNGKVDLSYTGLATNQYGTWYMVNGKVASNISGLTKVSKVWMYLVKGKVDTSYVGLAKNENGWWYVENGTVDFTYTGMAKNQHGWWYVTNGKLDKTFTGISYNVNGSWYLKDGTVDFTYTGEVEYNGVTYNINKGKVVK